MLRSDVKDKLVAAFPLDLRDGTLLDDAEWDVLLDAVDAMIADQVAEALNVAEEAADAAMPRR